MVKILLFINSIYVKGLGGIPVNPHKEKAGTTSVFYK